MKNNFAAWAAGVATSMTVVLACACGGGQGAQAPSLIDGAGGAEERFTLSVLPDSFIDGATGSFHLEQRSAGDELVVDVVAEGASGLKALYFELAYDAVRFSPLEARASGLLSGGSESELIQLAYTEEPGRLTHGQVLTGWIGRPGFSGNAVLASLRFVRKPYERSERSLSAAPVSSLSRTTMMLEGDKLAWGFYSQGDYDQNSEVNISDLTPLGKLFQASVAPDKFPLDSEEQVTDGDDNGQINISDITPIGANFRRRVTGYNVYAAESSASYPQTADSVSGLPSIGSVLHGAHLPKVGQQRLRYEFTLPAQQLGKFYWVRPADGTEEGIASNMIEGEAPNNAPVASVSVNRDLGVPPLLVNFDASASGDSDGSIVNYEWDFEGDGTFEHSSGTSPLASHNYEANGTFPATLRVTDDDGAMATTSRTISVDDSLVGPVAVIGTDSQLGDAPFSVNFDASASTAGSNEISSYEWDFDGDGSFEEAGASSETFIYQNSGVYFPQLRVTDSIGFSAVQDTVIVVGNGVDFPQPSSVLAIPYDPTITAGQEARFTVYTYRANNPFKYMNGARMVLPPGVPYIAESLNAGIPGGASGAIDGIWALINPENGMLMPLESFITPINLQGGKVGYDISLTPLGGSQVINATGAMFNIAFDTVADLEVSFQTMDDLKRTYYSDTNAFEYTWSNTSNAGMPGITVE